MRIKNKTKKTKGRTDGFTLVEVLVAGTMFILIMGLMAGTFVQQMRSNRVSVAMMAVNDSMGFTLEQMAREIRTGYNFCTAEDVLEVVDEETRLRCLGLSSGDNNRELQLVNIRNEVVRYRINKTAEASSIERGIDMVNGGEITDGAACVAAFGAVSDDGEFCYQEITSDNVYIENFRTDVRYNNNIARGDADKFPPRVTMALGITSSEPDVRRIGIVINMQTTVSARNF